MSTGGLLTGQASGLERLKPPAGCESSPGRPGWSTWVVRGPAGIRYRPLLAIQYGISFDPGLVRLASRHALQDLRRLAEGEIP